MDAPGLFFAQDANSSAIMDSPPTAVANDGDARAIKPEFPPSLPPSAPLEE